MSDDFYNYHNRQNSMVYQYSGNNMSALVQMADIRLADVEASLQELDNISTSVAEYFCEDPAAFKLEECCSIFHSFCERFERATQVNCHVL